jgi:hypothetical protein
MLKKEAVKRKTTSLFLLVAGIGLFAGLLVGGADNACAQPIAASPCDTGYYDSLEARAWLEAQREITQNQNLIFKADSVLEYTCFDRFANVLAMQAINMFSETVRWGTILGPTSMDTALDNLVGEAMRDYLTANFDHTFLGGRMRPPLAVIDYIPAPVIIGGAYNCDMMDRVWTYAKCMDFADTPAEDGFFTFASYSTDPDKRFLPDRCANLGSAWTTNITNAGLSTTTGPPTWTPDNPRTYLNWMDPANCGNAAYPPIDTGITVSRPRATPANYVERVCIIPGCHYVPPTGGGTAAGTCAP